MKTSYWWSVATEVITTALDEAKAQGLDAKGTMALVDSRYPFGERKMWPYKQWLEARRRLCHRLIKRKPTDPKEVDPGFWAKLLASDGEVA